MFLHPQICVQVNACVIEPGASKKGIHGPTRCYNGSTLLRPPCWSLDPHAPTVWKVAVGAELEIYFSYFSVEK